jgi:ribonuclease P/MRP protein subunit RPP40
LSWIQEYLTGRTQQVTISGTLSDPVPLSSGIMAGSCIGPVLFLLYLNDLLDSLSTICHTVAYADDVKLYSDDPVKIQRALGVVESWCSTWQLGLSVEKCCVLLLGSGTEVPFTLSGKVLPYSSSVKDLGVLLDKNLSFSDHCTYIVKKARRTTGIVLRCFSSGKVSLLKKAYLTYIRPQVETASQVWNSISVKDSKRLESVQRHFTKMLFLKCGLSRTASYEQRLRFLGLDALRLRRFKLDLSLTYKIYNNLTFCPGLLVRKTIGRTLQHNHRLQQEIAGKHRSSMFANRVVASWNMLADSVIEGPEELFYGHLQL